MLAALDILKPNLTSDRQKAEGRGGGGKQPKEPKEYVLKPFEEKEKEQIPIKPQTEKSQVPKKIGPKPGRTGFVGRWKK
jgi:hypothetical protein